MGYSAANSLTANLEAIKTAFGMDGAELSGAMRLAVLQGYSGFGGIKALLFPEATKQSWQKMGATETDLLLYDQVMELHEVLKRGFGTDYKQAIDSLRHSQLSAFYTPAFVPGTLFKALENRGASIERMYDPCAGAGIFPVEGFRLLKNLGGVTAVEKDIVTAKVLEEVLKSCGVPHEVNTCGFEQTGKVDRGLADLICGNIPYGAERIFDPELQPAKMTERIHNYFFAKGLEKIGDGGVLAFLTTDRFLNKPGNHFAREYLFSQADFISLTALPHNLMSAAAGTEAGSHLLIVQKNEGKTRMSAEEKALCEVVKLENQYGSYTFNQFLHEHPDRLFGNEIKEGRDQYGEAALEIWQKGQIEQIRPQLEHCLEKDLEERLDFSTLRRLQRNLGPVPNKTGGSPPKSWTYLQPPIIVNQLSAQPQLGLFDLVAAETQARALAYVNEKDENSIVRDSVKMLAVIKTAERPDHEAIVMLKAISRQNRTTKYKFFSNIGEINFPNRWMRAADATSYVEAVAKMLSSYNQQYLYEGDDSLRERFGIASDEKLLIRRISPVTKAGHILVHLGRVYLIEEVSADGQTATVSRLPLTQADLDFYQRYSQLRDLFLELTDKETHLQVEQPELREAARRAYYDFVTNFGILNKKENKKRILQDASGYVMLGGCERKITDGYEMADILERPQIRPPELPDIDAPFEALSRSLNELGKVDLDFIAERTKMDRSEFPDALGDLIFCNPVTMDWLTADDFLSGNVVEKLIDARQMAEAFPNEPQFQRSLKAIEAVQPEKIPFELLSINMGERWVPNDYYKRYLSSLVETPVQVVYFPSVDQYRVESMTLSLKAVTEYQFDTKAKRLVKPQALFEHALANTTPRFTYTEKLPSGDEIKRNDEESTQLAQQKIDAIRDGFTSWMKELSEEEKRGLEKIYNDTYNCFRPRVYDGSHLTFPGLDRRAAGINDLYQTQKNAIWRITQERGALIDHVAGGGKTLIMVCASQEKKRLGLCKKPMILALKTNVSQIADAYRRAYPNARILAPGKEDFTPAERRRIFLEIQNNDWDGIILTHQQFMKIPQSPAIQLQIFQAELDNLNKDLRELQHQGLRMTTAIRKGLERRKSNLSVKLAHIQHQIAKQKDDWVDFATMGIDDLYVDESHIYKNLLYTTRHDRVSGLNSQAGSQRALNMLFAVRTLQAKHNADKCATFLSGTPITNSLVEAYAIFKYLTPRELQRQQIENFDSWAALFAVKTRDFEFSVTNEIASKERFRLFKNLPELGLMYNMVADYKAEEHVRLDAPRLVEELVTLEPTADQQEFMQRLIAFAKTGDGKYIGRPHLSDEEKKAKMLIVTTLAKKMAVDMRLISRIYDDDPGNKVSEVAKRVAEIYEQSQSFKGVQLIFCDLGTPAAKGFNVYQAIKDKLVNQYELPAHAIAFIHDWPEEKRPQFFDMINRGDINVVLLSTEKGGTGTNIQQKAIANHHVDVTWKPAELEQRNKRSARPGNDAAKLFTDNTVKSFVYAVKRSLDSYRFNVLKSKDVFIKQLKKCELNVRTIDEGAFDTSGAINFAECLAILSGDNSLLEKSKLEKEIQRLELIRTAHFRQTARSRRWLEFASNNLHKTQPLLEKIRQDNALYQQHHKDSDPAVDASPLRLNFTASTKKADIGKDLIALVQEPMRESSCGIPRRIGELYGFDIYIEKEKAVLSLSGAKEYVQLYAQSPLTGQRYFHDHPLTNDPMLMENGLIRQLSKIPVILAEKSTELEQYEKDVQQLSKVVNTPFVHESEITSLKEQIVQLDRRIQQSAELSQITVDALIIPDKSTVEIAFEELEEITIAPSTPKQQILKF